MVEIMIIINEIETFYQRKLTSSCSTPAQNFPVEEFNSCLPSCSPEILSEE